jgi:hypothetical protein
MLWAENARSVAYRYPLDDNSELNAEVAGYRFKRYPPLTPHAAAKIIAAYNYQACETPDYDETPAAHAVAAFAPLLPVYSAANERPEFVRIPEGTATLRRRYGSLRERASLGTCNPRSGT